LVRWDLPVSLTPWMGRRQNGATRVMSCAKACCASLWSGDRPIEWWSDSGPVRACIVVLGMAFVERKALSNEGGDFGGSLVVEVNKPSESVQPFPFHPIEAAEHDFVSFTPLDEAVDGLPFEAAPFLLLVVVAQDDYEVGFIVVEIQEIEGKVTARKLGLVVLVVEEALFTELPREDACNLRDELPFVPGK
jgi:hypothetical protein